MMLIRAALNDHAFLWTHQCCIMFCYLITNASKPDREDWNYKRKEMDAVKTGIRGE